MKNDKGDKLQTMVVETIQNTLYSYSVIFEMGVSLVTRSGGGGSWAEGTFSYYM